MTNRSIDRVRGPCPFCYRTGGTIDADFDGQAGNGAAIYHSLPTCADYNRLSGDEFIKAVIARKHTS